MDWDFWKPVIAGQVRHLVTVGAGVLVTDGAIGAGDQENAIKIGTGIAMWGIVAAWSWWQKVGQKRGADELAKLQGAKK